MVAKQQEAQAEHPFQGRGFDWRTGRQRDYDEARAEQLLFMRLLADLRQRNLLQQRQTADSDDEDTGEVVRPGGIAFDLMDDDDDEVLLDEEPEDTNADQETAD